MRQCVRCGKACRATFCDDCRSFLRGELKKGSAAYKDVSTYMTSPQPVAGNPVTPLPLVNDQYSTQVERAIQNLQDAARRIEAVERLERRERRSPHASRLSPLRDISADIQ